MAGLGEMIIKHRIVIIGLVLLFTAVMLYELQNLRMETDLLASMPADDPVVKLFNETGEKYGGDFIEIVAVEAPEGDIFTYDALSLVRKLTETYKKLDGVRDVISLTNIIDMKKVEGGLEVGRLVPKEEIPREPEKLKALRNYTLSKDMYRGNLVSSDGKYTAVVVRLEQDVNKQLIATEIKKSGEKLRGGFRLYYGGVPAIMDYLGQVIMKDLMILLPVIIIILAVTLYLGFRTLAGVMLPMGTVFISVIWALGAMAITGAPITMVSNILPVVLFACGIAYGIHTLNMIYEELRNGKTKKEAIKTAVGEVGLPVILTGLTTFIGFVSLVSADLSIMRDFGVYTAIGILAALILSITFLPAVSSFIPLSNPRILKNGNEQSDEKRHGLLERILLGVAGLPVNHRWTVLTVSGLIVLVSLIFVSRLTTSVNMTNYFPAGSIPRVSQELMEDEFGGSSQAQMIVKGDMKNPAVVKILRRVEQEMDALPHVHYPQSAGGLIAEMNNVMNGRYTVPSTRDGLGNLWFFIEGQDILGQMVSPEMDEGVVQAKVDKEDTGVQKETSVGMNEIADRLSGKYVPLIKKECPEQTKKLFDEIRIEKTAELILLDLRAANIKAVPNLDETSRFISDIMKRIDSDDSVDSVDWKPVIDIIESYLSSDESEIYFPEEKRKAISKGIKKLLGNHDFKKTRVTALLDSVLHSVPYDSDEAFKEDLEFVPDMSSSIVTLASEKMDEIKVESIYNALVKKIFQDPEQGMGGNLERNISADLQQLVEPVCFVTPDEFIKCMGSTPPEDETVEVTLLPTGMPVVLDRLNSRLIKSQIDSLFVSLVLVLLLLMLQLKSVTGGLISIVPIAITVLLNLGVMGVLGVPIDNATMMISSIAIGIGIDYTIHVTSRLKMEYSSGKSTREALKRTMLITGRAIIVNTISVMLGFIVLMFSTTVPLRRFGWLTASTMLYSLLGALIIVPALILVTGASYMKKHSAG